MRPFLKRSGSRRRCTRVRVEYHAVRAHHLVVLVVDDVAVPDVAVPTVGVEREVQGSLRVICEQIRRRPAYPDARHLPRVHDHRVLPASLVVLRGPKRSLQDRHHIFLDGCL
jgi:hypothetical protein